MSNTHSIRSTIHQPPITISPSNNHYSPFTNHHSALRWYALYTRPRHEKAVAEQLERRQIEAFRPLREVLSRWKDRRKLVQLPLFPGYVFVHSDLWRKRDIVSVPGVVFMVGFDGAPAPIPDEQIEAVRQVCLTKLPCDPYPYLTVGRWVRVVRGPLSGLAGILIKKKSKHRLVVSIDILKQSVSVEMDADSAVPLDW
ncbi:MAG: UpxY family transcription antiterminator [candidate division NC10 bacterium]|nr:UpxY family transcription antiterminator [candidate division NC10 bacterium]